MSCYSNISLDEFCSPLHDAASKEPFASQFVNLSMSGDRRGMVEMFMEMPHVTKFRLADSYQGKNDIQATELYEQSIKTITQHGNKSAKETGIYSYNILTKALFMASANGRIFLDVLYARIRHSYRLKAFANCLKDCECMLALPTSFYDDSKESLKYFMQRRKECLQLERECSRNLARASSGKRGNRSNACLAHESSSNNTSSGNRAVVPSVDGKPHNYLESCSDSVMLQFDKTKGRHLVAARDIKPGAVLVVDQPFSYSTDEVALNRNCLHCHATLKSEDNIKIPCRNCQTVSRAHDYVHACTCCISEYSDYYYIFSLLFLSFYLFPQSNLTITLTNSNFFYPILIRFHFFLRFPFVQKHAARKRGRSIINMNVQYLIIFLKIR